MKKLMMLIVLFALACGQSPTSTRDTAPSVEPKGGLQTEAVPGTGCSAGGWLVSSVNGCAYGTIYGVSDVTCEQGLASECWSFDTSGFGQFETHIVNARTGGQMGTNFQSTGDDYTVTASGNVPLLFQLWSGAIGPDTTHRYAPTSCLVNSRDINGNIFFTIDSNDGCSVAENNAYLNQAMTVMVGFQSAIATTLYVQPGGHVTYLDWPANGHCNTNGLTPAIVTQASTNVVNGLEQPQGGQVLAFSMPGFGQQGYPAAGITITTSACNGATLQPDGNGNVSWGPPASGHQYLVIRDPASSDVHSQLLDVTTNQCTRWPTSVGGPPPTAAPCAGNDATETVYPTYANP